ncbi:zinc finger BED domain-containing protein RICESLEEPER 1-like [Cynara cardunculus var. scolymus]|uniref:zinc finger BED domain-containing protein RICESLEEPER 1-like n=1 Tax=Cynara cardunculus var. scolymus TaxID=59895 RepID=UPI000D6268F5|nr:zinc finger BED domain-containing protein RICESLEEPER 1-like [Cynara cardunculus var. scolymus]
MAMDSGEGDCCSSGGVGVNNTSNMVEISEEDDLQSPPPSSKNNEKKPINQLKPNKFGVEFKCQRKLTSKVWNSFDFMDPDENEYEGIMKCFTYLNPEVKVVSRNTIKDWGIQKKVFSITLDNASSNDAMVDFLKTEIDLDELKEADDAIIKVKNTVKYYKVLYYKKAFIHLAKTDANYLHCPTSDEWGRIERTFKFLKVFYEKTCAFSSSKYTTTNLYFANVLTVIMLLHKEKDSDDTFMKNMASRKYEKFEKYWANFSTVMAFAAVLDPRYKFQIVEWGYEKVYGHEYKSELAIIKKKLFSLFDEYVDESHLNKTKVGQPKSGSLDSQEGSQDVLDVASASLMMNFDTFSNKVTSQVVKSELECYLEEKLMPRVINLNILDYWRTHEVRYPTLARIARDILAIPISTVASESAFSIGGRVLDAYRSSLKSSYN